MTEPKSLMGYIVKANGSSHRWYVVEHDGGTGWLSFMGLRRLHRGNVLGETYWSGCSPEDITWKRKAKPGEIK